MIRKSTHNKIHWKGCDLREGKEYRIECFQHWISLKFLVKWHQWKVLFLMEKYQALVQLVLVDIIWNQVHPYFDSIPIPILIYIISFFSFLSCASTKPLLSTSLSFVTIWIRSFLILDTKFPLVKSVSLQMPRLLTGPGIRPWNSTS